MMRKYKIGTFFLIAGLCPLISAGRSTIRITSPASGTVVHPGDTVPVSVETSGKYFAGVMIDAQIPIIGDALTTPPFHFSIHIPKNIKPGVYSLIASGATAPDQVEESEMVLLDVEMPEPPITVRTSPTLMSGMKVGDQDTINVYGKYKDGETASLSNSKQTTFVSLDTTVVTVSDDGLVTAVGPGSTEIVVHVGELEAHVKVRVVKGETGTETRPR
jgi:Bacterial Ig-like domain (group 2)